MDHIQVLNLYEILKSEIESEVPSFDNYSYFDVGVFNHEMAGNYFLIKRQVTADQWNGYSR